MKTFKIIIVLLALWACSAHAEDVYKCKMPNGEMLYQPTPCPSSDTAKGVLKIKEMTPQEKEAAKAKLQAEQQEEAAYEAAKAEEAKQRQMEIQKQQELELERQRIAAQQKAAQEAERRRAWGSTYMPPYYRNQGN